MGGCPKELMSCFWSVPRVTIGSSARPGSGRISTGRHLMGWSAGHPTRRTRPEAVLWVRSSPRVGCGLVSRPAYWARPKVSSGFLETCGRASVAVGRLRHNSRVEDRLKAELRTRRPSPGASGARYPRHSVSSTVVWKSASMRPGISSSATSASSFSLGLPTNSRLSRGHFSRDGPKSVCSV